MADVQTYDELVDLISDGFGAGGLPMRNYLRGNGSSFLNGSSNGTVARTTLGFYTLPSLPSGVTKYRPTFVSSIAANGSNLSILVGKMIDMGSLDISTNVFTTGSAYPSRRELGTNSVQTSGLLYVHPTVTLGGTVGTLNINYTDQGGNSGTVAYAMSSGGNLGAFIQLASGDSGVQSITNTTNRSGGAAPTGTVKFYGIMPIAISVAAPTSSMIGFNNLTTNFCFPELGAGDVIGLIDISTGTTNSSSLAYMWIVGER